MSDLVMEMSFLHQNDLSNDVETLHTYHSQRGGARLLLRYHIIKCLHAVIKSHPLPLHRSILQLITQDLLWQPIVVHSDQMDSPSRSVFNNETFQAGYLCFSLFDFQQFSQFSHVVIFLFLVISTVAHVSDV